MKTNFINQFQREADDYGCPTNWYDEYKKEKELKEHAQKLCIERLEEIKSLQKQLEQTQPVSSTELVEKLNFPMGGRVLTNPPSVKEEVKTTDCGCLLCEEIRKEKTTDLEREARNYYWHKTGNVFAENSRPDLIIGYVDGAKIHCTDGLEELIEWGKLQEDGDKGNAEYENGFIACLNFILTKAKEIKEQLNK